MDNRKQLLKEYKEVMKEWHQVKMQKELIEIDMRELERQLEHNSHGLHVPRCY